MSNKNNKTEELHKLEALTSKIDASYHQWYEENKDNLKSPPLDLSFMKDHPELLNHQNTIEDETPANQDRIVESAEDNDSPLCEESSLSVKLPSSKQTSHHRGYLSSIRNAAAIFIIAVVLSAAMTIGSNSNVVHAVKFHIQKTFHEIGSRLYTTENSDTPEDDSIETIITDPKKLDNSRRYFPQVLIPQSIPEGYSLVEAEIKVWMNGRKQANFHFEDSEDHFFYITESTYDENSHISIMLPSEEITLSNGITGYYAEETEESRGIYYMTGELFVQIQGTAAKEDILDVEKNLQ